MLQTFNTLQRLHPTNTNPDSVKQSDSIRKLLEVLPVADRKWIKIENPAVNTYWEVLKQILTYVEKEPNLKLTIEDIERENKPKAGTIEVNLVHESSGGKSAEVNSVAASKGQTPKSSNNQGGKQNSDNANKQCHF